MEYWHETIIDEKRYKQLTSHNCVFSLEYLLNKGLKCSGSKKLLDNSTQQCYNVLK